MPNNESAVQIAVASPATPNGSVGIRVFTVIDPLTKGPVQIQGVVLCDENGEPLLPLSEGTGQDLLKVLKSINNILALTYGVGEQLD